MNPDPSLNDEQLEAEIKLVGELVLAASQSEDSLSDDEIDEILQREPDDAAGSAGTSGAAGPPGAAGTPAVTDED